MVSNCHIKHDLPVMGMGAQPKNNKIFLSITDPIEGCINLKANTYTSLSSTGGTPSSSWKNFDKPVDQLNCPEPLCITSGTLYVNFLVSGNPLIPHSTVLTYQTDDSAFDYVNGVINTYIVLTGAGSYSVTQSVTDQCGGGVVTLTSTVTGGVGEVYPKTVAVTHAFDEANTLLTPSECGMKITVSILPQDAASAAKAVGVSSVSVVQDKSDFEKNDVVAITCVDDIDLPTEIDLTDPSCLGRRANTDAVEQVFTINAQQVTGNMWKMNHLFRETERTKAFDVEVKKRPIVAHTINGITRYSIRLPHFYGEECSFVSAYLPACDAIEGKLIYNSIKNMAEPDIEAFKILTDQATGYKYMVFNESHKGLETTITYPVEKNATVYDATTNIVDGRIIRVLIPLEYQNGYKGYILSENAFVTSFPFGWSSTDNTPFSFQITLLKKKDKFYELVILDKDN